MTVAGSQENKVPATGQNHKPPVFAHRQLTILAADVVDYSRLTEAAEEDTHIRLRALRVRTIDPCVVSYRGRVIKNTGDGFLAAFDSSGDAVACAIAIQTESQVAEASESADRRIRLRMGLNAGDVIAEPEDIYGNSVNIAARLEQCAPPGGIVVSEDLFKVVKSKHDIGLEDLGRLRLKNISRPVHAYSLRLPGADQAALPTQRTRGARRARIPSIVVLPFRTTGENQQDAYFGQGMVDDVIVGLASIQGLLVISRTSALSYSTGEVDLQRIGQELGVRYVLSGSVRRAARGLRVTAELADVETGSVIWADTYDGALTDLFDLQDRIATRIVWSLAPNVREAELKRALRKRPQNMTAYDLVLRAIDLIYRMDFADFSKAGTLLEQAIAADDSYAMAYAYAALWYVHRVNQDWSHDRKADSFEAARLAAAAVDRDPSNGFALAIHGHTSAVLFRDYDKALGLFDRALSAAPGNAMVWTLSSGTYSYTGQAKAAIERAEKGMRLSPVDSQAFFYLIFLSLAHYVDGSFEEAVIWAHKSMALNARLLTSMRWLIGSLVALDRMEEAREVARHLLQVQPRFRVSSYAEWCPLKGDLRDDLLQRLHAAGIPD